MIPTGRKSKTRIKNKKEYSEIIDHSKKKLAEIEKEQEELLATL